MPDHLHIIFHPQGDKSFYDFMRAIKSFSAKLILDKQGPQTLRSSLPTYPIRHVWQSGFHDDVINDTYKQSCIIEYIRLNPVRAGLSERPADYCWTYVNPQYQS